MFSFGLPKAHRVAKFAIWAGAAVAFSLVASAGPSAAQAQEIQSSGCVGGWHTFNCVTRWAPAEDPFIRVVPHSTDPADQAASKERYRRWVDRCRPTIGHDRYGVARYYYAVPGCEFGVGEY